MNKTKLLIAPLLVVPLLASCNNGGATEYKVDILDTNGVTVTPTKAVKGKDYAGTISIATDMIDKQVLPEALDKVTSGNKALQPTEYTYTLKEDKLSADFIIPAANIVGDVVIQLTLEDKPDPLKKPINFKCVSDKATLNVYPLLKLSAGNNETSSLQYSKDCVEWKNVEFSSLEIKIATFTLSKDETYYFRSDANTTGGVFGYCFGSALDKDLKFIHDGDLVVSGNIMSLLKKEDFSTLTTLSDDAFVNLFGSNKNLVDANNLLLPATTLAEYCYSDMFKSCEELKAVPKLSASTLAPHCYTSMFNGCSSLNAVPELPATNLEEGCYKYMFEECSSLTAAPELPATALAKDCYYSMFLGCSNLKFIKVGFGNGTNWPEALDCTHDWLYNVALNGTFIWNGSTNIEELQAAGLIDQRSASGDINHIPAGWTVENPK